MKEQVRERYARAATSMADEPDGTPPTLGLGDVVELARLRTGETVLDLGSGPGRDLFAAARAVGQTGRAIGVDMTAEMLERSRATAASMPNVSILDGDLERLPLPCGSVDVVISNCVINLVDDKRRALTEALRVLRPGGRLAVLDTAFETEPGEHARAEADWCGCVAGSLVATDYEALLDEIGFTDVRLRWENAHCGEEDLRARAVAVTATKPETAMPGPCVVPAVPADRDRIEALLRDAGLPLDDLRIEDALVALEDGEVVGAVALERAGVASLLRSLVVDHSHRRQGFGYRLLGGTLDVARWSGAGEVYLYTTDAQGYFERFGFEPVETTVAAKALPGSDLRPGCSTATAMRLSFEEADLPMLGKPSSKPLPLVGDCSCC